MTSNPEPTRTPAGAEAAKLAEPDPSRYHLSLYITGTSARSARAVVHVRDLCERHLKGRYELDVVDIAQHPEVARGEQLVAVPTLIRRQPLPLCRFVGDMSGNERLMRGLNIAARDDAL